VVQGHFPRWASPTISTRSRSWQRNIFEAIGLAPSGDDKDLLALRGSKDVEMPHLGNDLDHPFDRSFDKVFAGGFVIDVLHQALANHVIERLEGEIRIDGAATITDQEREMMDLARFTRFEHQADAGAGALRE